MVAMKYKNDYREQIRKELNNCITETDLPIGKKYRGKVRDMYDIDDKLILLTLLSFFFPRLKLLISLLTLRAFSKVSASFLADFKAFSRP